MGKCTDGGGLGRRCFKEMLCDLFCKFFKIVEAKVKDGLKMIFLVVSWWKGPKLDLQD